MLKNILITGLPRSGKSTLLNHVLADIPHKVGFVTNELRNETGRVGFEMETHNGTKSTLAHVDFETPHQVSRYFVDVPNLERILPEVAEFSESDLLYLDEIGQMELFSKDFEKLVETYLNSQNTVLATLSVVYQNAFTDLIRQRKDVYLVDLSEDTRVEKTAFVKELLNKITKAKRYLLEPERFVRKEDVVELTSDHGLRTLRKEGERWVCNCEFFAGYQICSHVIAVEELCKS